MVDQLSAFASEVTRVALEVGTPGILGGQAKVECVQGTWADLTKNVNKMALKLTNQMRPISVVTKDVANGDLSQQVDVDVQGEMLERRNTVNSMVHQLSTLTRGVTHANLEVGIEGRGEWSRLTDHVNVLVDNLMKRIDVDGKEEMLELEETVNDMIERLSIFADARSGNGGRNGGKLRGQDVEGVDRM
ncbi:hypothetical protein DL96DRAFT_1714472 [Flagelloscypha sp. PMI_526]|nr:hypothetical protein DL96DRAFT_1714472 [Flagelloscypha sp. PMI_526]